MADTEWWRDHDNIVTLVAYMADVHMDVKEVAHAVEKPWHYDDIWADARTWAED